MKALLDGLRRLGTARLAALAGVGAAVLLLLGLVAFSGGAGPDALLYGDLDPKDAAAMSDALDRAHIPHTASPAGDRVFVAEGDVPRARMLLAKSGLPSGGSVGYEIFDHADALTATDFTQDINRTRALEGELARSIRLLDGVRGARVHLVLPRREPFSRDVQPAQASVVLTTRGAGRLDPGAVQAILNLVAAAVPGLKPSAIAVIDSRGTLLARAGQPTGPDEMMETAEELRRSTELRLSHAVEEMLEQSLGPGHVRAEAAVRMNYERVHEEAEQFNPDQQVPRSTQSVTDTNKSTESDKAVTVQNNLPNADLNGTQSGSQSQRQEETTNYEIGKTVRTLIRDQPEIARISLAVLVDGETVTGADGKAHWQERSAPELDRIQRLVKRAIGFDEKRGDTVDVVSMRFAEPAAGDAVDDGGLLGTLRTAAPGLVRAGLLAVLGLALTLLVLRPMALRLTNAPLVDEAVLSDGGAMKLLPSPDRAGGGPAALPAPLEAMLDIARVEGQMRASSLRALVDAVEKQPEDSLNLLRLWLAEERA